MCQSFAMDVLCSIQCFFPTDELLKMLQQNTINTYDKTYLIFCWIAGVQSLGLLVLMCDIQILHVRSEC